MIKIFSLGDRLRPKTAFICPKVEMSPLDEIVLKFVREDRLHIDLVLKEVTLKRGKIYKDDDLSKINHLWVDYQPNSFAWPFMSEKMKAIVEANLTGNECIDWIEAEIFANKEKRVYYLPKFTKFLDVLDTNKTTYVDGTDHIIKPVFSSEKVSNLSLLNKPSRFNNQITSGLYVSEKLKNALEKDKIKGIEFNPSSVSEE